MSKTLSELITELSKAAEKATPDGSYLSGKTVYPSPVLIQVSHLDILRLCAALTEARELAEFYGAGKSWDERTVLVTGALVCHEYETSDVEDDAGDKARAFLAKYFPKGGGMSYGKCPLCAFDFSTSAGRTHFCGVCFRFAIYSRWP